MKKTEKTNNVETRFIVSNGKFNKQDTIYRVSNKRTNTAFTLVELIIVITILAILATIGFMSYQSYTLDARDANRTTSLKTMADGLTMYQVKNTSYPMPDSPVTISISGTTISYQGLAGTTVLSSIKASDTKDPSDNAYYTYLINKDKNSFQLLAMLENNPNIVALSPDSMESGLGEQVYARNYTNRYAKIFGDSLGILLDSTTNTPIRTNTDLFLAQSGTIYKVVITDKVTRALKGVELGGPLQMLALKGGSFARASNCEAGYIGVPGNADFMQPGFCVAKYEMKIQGNDVGTTTYNASMVAESRAAGTPWVDISQPQAITECNALGAGYHLITNNEWMTVARNIEANSQNWSGTVLNSGHNDGSPSNSLSASTNDSDGYNQTGNSSGNQKRTHTLSNGQVIWDLAGNAREHVNGTNNTRSTDGVVSTGNACSNNSWNSWYGTETVANAELECEFSNGYTKALYGPLGNYNADNGVGRIYSWSSNSDRIFLRGAGWDDSANAGVFTLILTDDSNDYDDHLGFRCAK